MKTQIRVCKTNPEKGHQNLTFEFLIRTDAHDPRYLEHAFSIVWSASSEIEGWYSMTFHCDTQKLVHVAYMAKVCAALQKADLYYEDNKPEIIQEVLGCERYVYDNGHYVREKLNGCKVFRLMKDGRCWTVYHCFTEQMAYEYMTKIVQPRCGKQADWKVELMVDKVVFDIKNFEIEV